MHKGNEEEETFEGRKKKKKTFTKIQKLTNIYILDHGQYCDSGIYSWDFGQVF